MPCLNKIKKKNIWKKLHYFEGFPLCGFYSISSLANRNCFLFFFLSSNLSNWESHTWNYTKWETITLSSPRPLRFRSVLMSKRWNLSELAELAREICIKWEWKGIRQVTELVPLLLWTSNSFVTFIENGKLHNFMPQCMWHKNGTNSVKRRFRLFIASINSWQFGSVLNNMINYR